MLPSVIQYREALRSAPLTCIQRRAIMCIYSLPHHRCTAGQLAALLGYSAHGSGNLAFGGAARVIWQYLGFPAPSSDWFSILATWDRETRSWELHSDFTLAIEQTEDLSDAIEFEVHPEEIRGNFYEGATASTQVTIYERSSEARRACIAHYGCRCFACGFSFEDFYGSLGRNFIHVHHLIPISSIGEEYRIDPIKDLRPLCPNCHAMIHRRVPHITIEELKDTIQT